MLDNKTICIIGCGNMGEALICGILRSKLFPPERMIGVDSDQEKIKLIRKKYAIHISREPEKIKEKINFLILAVKPRDMEGLLEKIGGIITSDTIVISIAAGIKTAFIEEKIGVAAPVVRVMPNTPALLCLGISGLCRGKHADDIDEREVTEIMSSVGEVVAVNEENMDVITALSGSGPAYMFYFIEALMEAGIAEGLDRNAARELAVRTMTGSAYMLMETDDSPASLRKKVTSPGGTTEAALKVFEESGFREIIKKAVQSAVKKSKELSKR